PVSDAAERLMLENFNKFDRGEEPTGRVDLRVGY
ncbi:glyoxylate/hydroxypyruvate reductase A, partial [Mesorhizobium sp. M2A.F.Ca.ET.040.01.1.1]